MRKNQDKRNEKGNSRDDSARYKDYRGHCRETRSVVSKRNFEVDMVEVN